jgi:superfamily II DNA or RNA helicase
MFRSQGYRSAVVHGSMPQNEIDTILTGLGTGEIQVVTSCDLISEGTDIPAIGCAILLRPTMSLSLYIQQIGRALRPCSGKTEAIILDHVGNVKRHGHPLSEFEWSLEGVKKKTKSENTEAVLKVKECESCYRVFEATAECCPSCGWIPEKKERNLEIVDGELQELLMTERERKEAERERKAAEKQRAEENNRLKKMARTYEELLKLEKQAGYKPGWAWNVFNSRKNKKR